MSKFTVRLGAWFSAESTDGTLEVTYRGEPAAFAELPAAPRNQKPESATGHVPYPRGITRPGLEHPYKRNAEREMKQRRRRLLARRKPGKPGGNRGQTGRFLIG